MNVDSQDGGTVRATTGLPQGSPISPVFAIYIAEIHGAVENQVE